MTEISKSALRSSSAMYFASPASVCGSAAKPPRLMNGSTPRSRMRRSMRLRSSFPISGTNTFSVPWRCEMLMYR
jgi:hypothetical protein